MDRTNAPLGPVPTQRTAEYVARVAAHLLVARRCPTDQHLLRGLGASNAVSVTILSDGAEWPRRGREREAQSDQRCAGWVPLGFGCAPCCARTVNGLPHDKREQRRE
jgi:hypothetical protein